MNKIVDELKKVGVFYIATADGAGARVRPFSSVTEYEGEAYLCCGNFKEVYRQIKSCPRIELCGMYPTGGEWLRVAATAVEDDRIEVQRAMLADPTGPSMLYKADDGLFVVFKIEDVRAVRFAFGKEPEVLSEDETS